MEIVPAVHGRAPRAARSAPTSDGAARAGGACGPAGRSGVRRSWFFLFAGLTAQAVAFELDAVGIVNDAVQYRVAEGGIGNDVMPLRHRDLACDQQGSLVVAIIDDLEQIAALVGGERFRSPVVDDEQMDAFERRDQARQTAFAARLGEIGEQAGCSLVEDGEAVAAGLVAERAGKPGLADAGWADNDQVVAVADPLTGGEVLEERTIETAGGAIVDVLDGGGLAQLGLAKRRVRRRFSRVVTSRSTRRPSQSSCGISAASGLFCSSMKASAMAARPRARKRSTVGWISMLISPDQL